jgi:hypothetical protein
MKFFWHMQNNQLVLALEDTDNTQHFAYQCLAHKDPKFRLLIPSAEVFRSLISGVKYPQPPYTPQQKFMAFDKRPILAPTILDIEPVLWTTSIEIDTPDFNQADFDYGERDRLGEPNVCQTRYQYTQMYRASERKHQLNYDLRNDLNTSFGMIIWDFIVKPPAKGGTSLPYPPAYGP